MDATNKEKEAVDKAFFYNKKVVEDALSSPKKIAAARSLLYGQVMATLKGRADSEAVKHLIGQRLNKLKLTKHETMLRTSSDSRSEQEKDFREKHSNTITGV